MVCLENHATHAVLPCGHLSLCHTCADAVIPPAEGGECPICRTPAHATVRIFKAAGQQQRPDSSEERFSRDDRKVRRMQGMGFITCAVAAAARVGYLQAESGSALIPSAGQIPALVATGLSLLFSISCTLSELKGFDIRTSAQSADVLARCWSTVLICFVLMCALNKGLFITHE